MILNELFDKELYEYLKKINIPNDVISSCGKKVSTVGDLWKLPYFFTRYNEIDFSIFKNEAIKNSVKFYLIHCIKSISLIEAINSYYVIKNLFSSESDLVLLVDIDSQDRFSSTLINVINKHLSYLKNENKLYKSYRLIRWYIWCSDNINQPPFSRNYAHTLSQIKVPGNPKGKSIKNMDIEKGPLTVHELNEIISGLTNDSDMSFNAIQERAIVALMIAFGRNPSNYVFLHNSDYVEFDGSGNLISMLKIPRIKKRLSNPRDDFVQEYLIPKFSKFVKDLINANKLAFRTDCIDDIPLFVDFTRFDLNYLDLYYCDRQYIRKLLNKFIYRVNVISPETNVRLKISPRRIRYTFGTNMALQGISKSGLAFLLDHSDTQHVHVYYNTRDNIIKHLDAASAKKLSSYYSYFKGVVINSDEFTNSESLYFLDKSVNSNNLIELGKCGASTLCSLDPPYSCYLCPKYRPFSDVTIHESVLSFIIDRRSKFLTNEKQSRLALQVEDIIFAVANVINLCNAMVKDVG